MQQETTSTVKELVPEDKDKKEECDLGDNTSKFPTGNTDDKGLKKGEDLVCFRKSLSSPNIMTSYHGWVYVLWIVYYFKKNYNSYVFCSKNFIM